MKIYPGRLYRTNCGTIVKTRDENGISSVYPGEIFPSGCGKSECRNTRQVWNFRIEDGCWRSRQDEKNFHLHIIEEILP